MTSEQRNKKIIAGIEARTKRALLSAQSARAMLIKEGIYTAEGKLSAEFGGEFNKLDSQNKQNMARA